MQKAIESLESTFALLSGTNLQEAYADLERLDLAGDDPEAAPRRSEAVRARERERIQQLFSNHAETERRAAALEQKIVASCRILEGIDPSRAEDQLREVHQLLS